MKAPQLVNDDGFDVQSLLSGIIDAAPENTSRRKIKRPVASSDVLKLTELRTNSSFDRADLVWLLNYGIPAFSPGGALRSDNPIPEIGKAAFVRFLFEYPEHLVLPRVPSAQEFFDLARSTPGFSDFSKSDIGLMFGALPATGYRWLRPSTVKRANGRIDTKDGRKRHVRRMMTTLYHAAIGMSASDREQLLLQWIDCLLYEFTARGVTPDHLLPKRSRQARKNSKTRRGGKLRPTGDGQSAIMRIWRARIADGSLAIGVDAGPGAGVSVLGGSKTKRKPATGTKRPPKKAS